MDTYSVNTLGHFIPLSHFSTRSSFPISNRLHPFTNLQDLFTEKSSRFQQESAAVKCWWIKGASNKEE